MRLCVLGSGSGGNCSVLTTRQADGTDQSLLIDAGFGPYTTIKRLAQAGVAIEQVKAMVLTHLDRDHYRPTWRRTIERFGIHVWMHQWHADAARKTADGAALETAGLLHGFGRQFEPLPEMGVSAIRLPHDTKGTIGFLIARAAGNGGGAARLGYATDMGCVPPELIDAFSAEGGVDLLAIESNYDPHLQQASPRPAFLKRRIMGRLGHLSNQQTFEAVCEIANRCGAGRPRQVVLLHRSRQCNHPGIIEEVFSQDGRLRDRIYLADQRRRSRWFTIEPSAPAVAAQQRLFR